MVGAFIDGIEWLLYLVFEVKRLLSMLNGKIILSRGKNMSKGIEGEV